MTYLTDEPIVAKAMKEGFKAIAADEPTEWLGNHTPFRCKRCGHYSDTRTPYCAYCGKKAINA